MVQTTNEAIQALKKKTENIDTSVQTLRADSQETDKRLKQHIEESTNITEDLQYRSQRMEDYNEATVEIVRELAEKVDNLEKQLVVANAPQYHYHDNRTFYVYLGKEQVDILSLKEPIPVIWYNAWNTGSKERRVFLPPQQPVYHVDMGEYAVNLQLSKNARGAAIEDIYLRHLQLPPEVARKLRCSPY